MRVRSAGPQLCMLALLACQAGSAGTPANPELARYLAGYAKEYQRLTYESQIAEWQSNTHIVEGDSTNAVRTRRANEALARFVGSNENITRIRGYLNDRKNLPPIQVRQLEMMLYFAAEKPESAAEMVTQRIAAEAAQTEKLYGFQFRLNRKPVSANAIDDSLRTVRKFPAGSPSGRLRKKSVRR